MPYLKYRDSRFPLLVGANRVGHGVDVDVRIPEMGKGVGKGLAVVAMIDVSPDATATVCKEAASPGVLRLNGIAVGEESAPLLHGDRLDLGDAEVRFASEVLSGDTLEVPIEFETLDAVESESAESSQVNGRLVSLTDGREYPVRKLGLRIGRDAASDVVVVSPEVSRRHATIRVVQDGYTLFDTSFNGVFLNDRRVHIEVPLGRGDTIRVGQEEFRFYADAELDPVEESDEEWVDGEGTDEGAVPASGSARGSSVADRQRAGHDIRAAIARSSARKSQRTRAVAARHAGSVKKSLGAFAVFAVFALVVYLLFVFVGIGGF